MEGEDFEKEAGNCCGGSFFLLLTNFCQCVIIIYMEEKGLTDRSVLQWNGRDCQSVMPQAENLV